MNLQNLFKEHATNAGKNWNAQILTKHDKYISICTKMNTKINIHHIILCWGMFKRISIIFYVSIVIKAE